MDGDWYYATDGDAVGPVSFHDLEQLARRGQLRREHLVWTDSMAGWEPASSVEQLWPKQPPPLPPRPAARAPASMSVSESPLATQTHEGSEFRSIGVRHVKDSDNWMVRHWQGELPLWKSYWLVGILLGMAYGIPFNILFTWMERAGLPRDQVITIILVSVAVMTALCVWQLVGIWRSAGRHTLATNGEWRRFWAILARIVCVIGGVQLASGIVMVLAAIAS